MKTLAIISQKGGVGKTTLATALAVAAERDGKNAAIFDLDPQASATFWKDTRPAESPAVAAIVHFQVAMTGFQEVNGGGQFNQGDPDGFGVADLGVENYHKFIWSYQYISSYGPH